MVEALATNICVLVASIASKVKSSFLIYRVQVRNRLEGIEADMAGEYSYPIIGGAIYDPNQVRTHSTSMSGIECLTDCSFVNAFTQKICFVSNWVALTQFIDITDKKFSVLCHCPLMHNFHRMYFVFKATVDHVAVVGYDAPLLEGRLEGGRRLDNDNDNDNDSFSYDNVFM